jgi:hypothetical protein
MEGGYGGGFAQFGAIVATLAVLVTNLDTIAEKQKRVIDTLLPDEMGAAPSAVPRTYVGYVNQDSGLSPVTHCEPPSRSSNRLELIDLSWKKDTVYRESNAQTYQLEIVPSATPGTGAICAKATCTGNPGRSNCSANFLLTVAEFSPIEPPLESTFKRALRQIVFGLTIGLPFLILYPFVGRIRKLASEKGR